MTGETKRLPHGARALLTVVACVGFAAAVMFAAGQGGETWGGETWGGAPVTLGVAAIAFVIQWVAFVPAYASQSERFYDLTGSLTYLSAIWIAVLSSGAFDLRSLGLAVLVSVWATRLGTFLALRIRRAGKDGRFDDIKPNAPRFFVAWTLQGLWVVLTLAAALAAVTTREATPLGWLDALGLGVWLLGFGIEVVADRQKSAFRDAHPGRFIDTGLWAWSRHPNYFGEIVLWVGVAMIACSTFEGARWLTLISPVFVYVLLTRISGVPLLEKRGRERWGEDPEYRAYVARTPSLIPRPPRG